MFWWFVTGYMCCSMYVFGKCVTSPVVRPLSWMGVILIAWSTLCGPVLVVSYAMPRRIGFGMQAVIMYPACVLCAFLPEQKVDNE